MSTNNLPGTDFQQSICFASAPASPSRNWQYTPATKEKIPAY